MFAGAAIGSDASGFHLCVGYRLVRAGNVELTAKWIAPLSFLAGLAAWLASAQRRTDRASERPIEGEETVWEEVDAANSG